MYKDVGASQSPGDSTIIAERRIPLEYTNRSH
jgi:hypothetical protein